VDAELNGHVHRQLHLAATEWEDFGTRRPKDRAIDVSENAKQAGFVRR